MASLNKVLLIGNITRDPEIRQTPGGQSVYKLGLATNRKFKSQSGEMREETTFVDVTVWEQRGDALAKYLKKGDPVFIEGRLTFEEWQDKTSGQKRTKLSVTAEDWQSRLVARRRRAERRARQVGIGLARRAAGGARRPRRRRSVARRRRRRAVLAGR